MYVFYTRRVFMFYSQELTMCQRVGYVYVLQGGCKISPEGYGHMMHMLKGLAMGRVIAVLEVQFIS